MRSPILCRKFLFPRIKICQVYAKKKPVGAWLAMIARNRANEFYRQAKPTEELTENIYQKKNQQAEANEILDAIRSLPETYSETLVLRLIEGMTGPEIADKTGLTPDSVRVNLHRGMKLLRKNSESRFKKMKDDYLWNKTGNDSEIEKLENTLQIFRCRENQPPQISNKVISFKKESPRKLFPVFRALAAGFIFAFALIGIWFYSNSKTEISQTKTVENGIQNVVSKKQNGIQSIEPEKTRIETISTAEKPEIRIEKPKSKVQKQNFRVQKLIYKPKAKYTKK